MGIQSCLPKHALDQLQLVDADSEDACSSQMLLLWQRDLASRRHDEVMLRMNAGMTLWVARRVVSRLWLPHDAPLTVAAAMRLLSNCPTSY